MDSVKFGNAERTLGMGAATSQERGAVSQRSLEHLLAAITAILLCVGVQMVQSASLTSRPSRQDELFLTRHLLWLSIATTAAWCASRLTAEQLERHARTLFWCFALLITAVLIPGIGTRINGAQRWIRFAGLSLQPSELGRLILPMVAAAEVLRQKRSGPFTLDGLPRTLLPLVLSIPLVVAEPDLGAAVFLTTGFLLALFFAGWPLRYFVLCGLLLAPAAAGSRHVSIKPVIRCSWYGRSTSSPADCRAPASAAAGKS
jgi:cell division protein FtsW